MNFVGPLNRFEFIHKDKIADSQNNQSMILKFNARKLTFCLVRCAFDGINFERFSLSVSLPQPSGDATGSYITTTTDADWLDWIVRLLRCTNYTLACVYGNSLISTSSSQPMVPRLRAWTLVVLTAPWSSLVCLPFLFCFCFSVPFSSLIFALSCVCIQIKSQNATLCVSLKSVPFSVWLGCWSSSQVIYICLHLHPYHSTPDSFFRHDP